MNPSGLDIGIYKLHVWWLDNPENITVIIMKRKSPKAFEVQ